MKTAILQERSSTVRRMTVGVLLLALIGPGCQSAPNTTADAAAGGLLGGLFGALVAGPRHALAGAAIGAGAGAVGGGIIGASADAQQKKAQQAAANAAAADQQAIAQRTLQYTDIVDLVRRGTSEDVIITQIRTSGAVYPVDANAIQYLTANGVSPRIIEELQATNVRGPRHVYVGAPATTVIYSRGGW
jgi:Glycine zipper